MKAKEFHIASQSNLVGAGLAPALDKSPAPTGWTPAEWEVFATGDEPFFELGKKLTEGFTYTFRGRARNSAGYGGY